MFLPFIILAISIGLSQSSSLLFKRIKSNYATIITMILFAILLFFMVSFSLTKVEHIQEISVCETNGALDQATVYVKETVPMGETILSNHWPWFGYHGNHQTLAIFNSSVSSIIDLSHVKPTRVIHVRYQGLYFNTTELQSDQRLILDKNFTDNCGFNVEVYFVNKSLKRI